RRRRRGHRPDGGAARKPRQEEGARSREGGRGRIAQGSAARATGRSRAQEGSQEIGPVAHSAAAHPYGVRDVERLLRLPRSTIQSLVDAGFVTPARGPRKSWLFSFRDLIVLRTAQALAQAQIPPRRINRSLKELKRRLPDTMPL